MKRKYAYFKNLTKDVQDIVFEKINDVNVSVVGIYLDKRKTVIIYEELTSYGFKTHSLCLLNRK